MVELLEKKACFPIPEIRKFYEMGRQLENDFLYAKYKQSVKSNYTKNFLEFLGRAKDKKNIVDCRGLPLVSGPDVCSVFGYHLDSEQITAGDLSVTINDYILRNNKEIKKEQFYDKYFLFVENLRRVTKDILKSPSVRFGFESDFLKTASQDYQNFFKYLINEADNQNRRDLEFIKSIWGK